MMFAKQAAKYFDNAEIIELHHNKKKDAPSGTAIKTALLMSQAKENFKNGNCIETENIKGSRGGTSYSNIQIHSVRLPGYVASQEVLFGSDGQVFKIRHDTTDRKCYMQGVLMAVRHVFTENDFTYGLEHLLK
jgi:4-hydroxy-tetrahydrodipicolinate reductase